MYYLKSKYNAFFSKLPLQAKTGNFLKKEFFSVFCPWSLLSCRRSLHFSLFFFFFNFSLIFHLILVFSCPFLNINLYISEEILDPPPVISILTQVQVNDLWIKSTIACYQPTTRVCPRVKCHLTKSSSTLQSSTFHV